MLVAALAGCSGSPYQLAPAAGQVTLNGEPLSGAKVMFAPVAKEGSQKAGKPAFGLLAPSGEFTLGTYAPEDGAVVGDHWVTVIRMETGRRTNRKSALSGAAWERVTYPERVTVSEEGVNRFAIALTSEICAKYGQAKF